MYLTNGMCEMRPSCIRCALYRKLCLFTCSPCVSGVVTLVGPAAGAAESDEEEEEGVSCCVWL